MKKLFKQITVLLLGQPHSDSWGYFSSLKPLCLKPSLVTSSVNYPMIALASASISLPGPRAVLVNAAMWPGYLRGTRLSGKAPWILPDISPYHGAWNMEVGFLWVTIKSLKEMKGTLDYPWTFQGEPLMFLFLFKKFFLRGACHSGFSD